MEMFYTTDALSAIDIDELGVRPFEKILRNPIDELFGNDKNMDFIVYSAELHLNHADKTDHEALKSSGDDDDDDDDDDNDGNNDYDIDPETGEKIFREENLIPNIQFPSPSSNDKWIEEYLLNIESSTSANQEPPTNPNPSFLENFHYQTDSDWFSNLFDFDGMVTDSILSGEYFGDNSIPSTTTTTTITTNQINIPHIIDEEYSISNSSSDQQQSYSSIENNDEITFIETKLEKIDHDETSARQISIRRSTTTNQGQQDEQILQQYNIPLTLEQITQTTTEEYNRRLAELTHLTTEQIHIIKDIRRRGKNKIAAQNCRKRKLIGVESLVEEVDELKRIKQELEEQKQIYEQQIAETRQKYEYLHRQVLPDHQLPPAIIVK